MRRPEDVVNNAKYAFQCVAHPYLPACRLREPQSPFVRERMLHIEVFLVVENGDRLVRIRRTVSCRLLLPIRRDGDGSQVDLF